MFTEKTASTIWTQIICWDVVLYEQYAKCYQPYNNPPNTFPPITCWASGCKSLIFKKINMPSMLNYFSSLPPSSLPSFVPTRYVAQEACKLDQEHLRKGHRQVSRGVGTNHSTEQRGRLQAPAEHSDRLSQDLAPTSASPRLGTPCCLLSAAWAQLPHQWPTFIQPCAPCFLHCHMSIHMEGLLPVFSKLEIPLTQPHTSFTFQSLPLGF